MRSLSKKDKAYLLLSEVERIYPNARTELKNWKTPFQFLVCIILSAQTTDRQVNRVTKTLFKKYSNANAFSNAKLIDLQDTIRGINFYKTKAKHIIEMSKILDNEYNSDPPNNLSLLIKLPGVGYKSANVFLNDLYKSNQGIAVDTHVLRVVRAYGLTENKDATKVAHDLEKLFIKDDWYKVNASFVLYGRYIFKAKKPDWDRVVLKEYLVI